MTESSIRSKKLFKYLSRFLTVLLLLALLLLGTFWYLASSNHEMVREKVADLLEEKLGTPAQISHYSISNTDHFPFLSVQINDLHIEGTDFPKHQRELLKIDKLAFLFHPFDVLRKKYTINKVEADGLTLQIYTDSLGRKNTNTLSSLFSKEPKGKGKPSLDIDQLILRNAQFDLTNDQFHKQHRFTIQEGVLRFADQDALMQIQLEAECLFEGLLFKEEKGAFLKNQSLSIKSDIEVDQENGAVRFLPSQLGIEEEEIQMQGQLTLADTNHLHLEFKTEGLLLDKARPLLNEGVNKVLRDIHLDQPVAAHFVLDGPMIPGTLMPATFDFSALDARLDFREHHLYDVELKGHFENNCLSIDRDEAKNGCLEIEKMSGRYGGDIPFELSALVRNLEDAEYLKLKAKASTPLSKMMRFFSDLPDLQLKEGRLATQLNFEGNPVSFLENRVGKEDHQLDGSLELINAGLSFTDQLSIQAINGRFYFDQKDVRLDQLQIEVNDLEARLNGQVKNAVQKFIGNPARLAADLQLFVKEINVDELLSNPAQTELTDSSTTILLSEQLNSLTTELNKRLDLRIGIQSDTVIYKGFKASDLDLLFEVAGDCGRGSVLGENSCLRISRLKAKVLDGIPIDVSFSLNQLDNPVLEIQVEGELPLQNVQAYFPVEEVNIESGDATLQLQAAAPLDDFSNWDKLLNQLNYNGSLILKNISGEHLPSQQKINGLNGQLQFDKEDIRIDALTFDYAEYSPKLSGNIKHYLAAWMEEEGIPETELVLNLPLVDLSSLPMEEHKDGIPRSYLPSDLLALFDQAFNYFQGQLTLSIDELIIPDYKMEDCSAILGLSTLTQSDKTIKTVEMNQFQARLWGNTSLKGELKVPDLSDPELIADLRVQIPITELGRMVTSRWLRFKDGFADLDFHYQTKIRDTLDAINYLLNADMDGSLTFISAEIDYTAREFMFNNINGTIDFNEEVLSTRGTDFVLNNNPAQVSGSCFDYLDFFILPDRKIKFELELDVPVFDFDYFRTPKDLGLSAYTSNLEPGSDKFEKLLNSGTMELTTKIQHLIYRNFQPKNVEGKIQLSADRVGLKDLRMSLAEGSFAIDGEISEIARHAPKANVTAKFTENNVSQVFFNFDNFGQEDMTHENIEGFFSADINFQSSLNDDYKVTPASISGTMDLSIYEGSLINLPAFKRLSGILFKKRRMDNISFDTLQTTTHLNGLDLLVDYFYIHSTSMDFGVEGRYSFGQGDRTYMLFEVPTGNIFKHYVPKEELSNQKKRRKGFPILIEAKDKKGKLKFKVRLFKKRRKLKEVLKRKDRKALAKSLKER